MSTTRRDFLLGGLSAGLTLPLAPRLLALPGASGGSSGNILVVLQLRGGFDTFNVLFPPDHPVYVQARPTIGIPRTEALRLQSTSDLHLHPALSEFKALFDAGRLAIVQGTGYPNPSLSHFQSEKYWYAADPTSLHVRRGWLASYHLNHPSAFALPSLNLASQLMPVYQGFPVPVLTNLNNFLFRVDTSNASTRQDQLMEQRFLRENAAVLRPTADPNLQYVADQKVAAHDAERILHGTGSQYQPAVSYPANALGNIFQLIARYVLHGLGTRIYYTTFGGFDTHANQGGSAGTMATRLANVSTVLKAFLDDLEAQDVSAARRVIVYLWSEFGRRVGENGSAGTDHGMASLNFIAGPAVRGGLYGTYPSLEGIQPPYHTRNVPHTTDFRQVYAELIDRWLGGDSSRVLPTGSPTQHLGFLPS